MTTRCLRGSACLCAFLGSVVFVFSAAAAPPAQAGFPIPLPGMGFAPVVGDIDDNGDLEIVLRVMNEDDPFLNYLYVFNHDGTNYPGWPLSQAAPGHNFGQTWNVPAIVDLDGDGDLEIIVASADYGWGGYKTYAYHHNGTLVTGFPLSAGWPANVNENCDLSPAIYYPAGGTPKIITAAEVYGGSPEATSHFYVYLYEANGALAPGSWPYHSAVTGANRVYSPAVADLDGDGQLEFVFPAIQQGQVYALEANGSPMAGSWPVNVDFFAREPVIADLTGDGDNEVVVASSYSGSDIYVLNGDGSVEAYWALTVGEIIRGPIVADVDGDGDREIIAGTYRSTPPANVYIWHHDGTLLTGWPVSVSESVWGMPVAGDLDHDGLQEVVVGAYDAYLYAWHPDGTLVADFPILIGPAPDRSGTAGAPCIVDLDLDGDVEILVANVENLYYQNETYLYGFDLPGPYNPTRTDWPMHRHDAMNTAFLPGPGQPLPQACCFQDGHCEDLLPIDCYDSFGIPQGSNTSCEEVQCPQPPQACCFPNGSCDDLPPGTCLAQGGTPQGPGTECATTDCPQPSGACCFPDGLCQQLTQAACQANQGQWRGPGTNCMLMECPVLPEACCFEDGQCQNWVPEKCRDAGGTPQGWYTACKGDHNGDGIDDRCQELPGDCDGDHDVDLDDYQRFPQCNTGPSGISTSYECTCYDLDMDQDVDLSDFAHFQAGFTGSTSPDQE